MAGKIKGFDDSHYQAILTETLARAALAQGYEFGFHKVSEGGGYLDPEWLASLAGAKAAGLPLAGYHLGRDTTSGASQYAFFAKHCPDGPAMLDVEAGPAMSTARSDDWVDSALADHRIAIVYGIYDQIKRHKGKALLFAVAWGGNDPGDAIFTQNGSAGAFGDLDYYHGSADDLAAIFGGGTMAAIDDVAKACGMTTEAFITAALSAASLGAAAAGNWTEPVNPDRKAALDFLKGLTGGGGADPTAIHLGDTVKVSKP